MIDITDQKLAEQADRSPYHRFRPARRHERPVADAARQARPGLKVLFVTGFAENAAIGDGRLPPGMEVITQPFPVADLPAKVSEIIEV